MALLLGHIKEVFSTSGLACSPISRTQIFLLCNEQNPPEVGNGIGMELTRLLSLQYLRLWREFSGYTSTQRCVSLARSLTACCDPKHTLTRSTSIDEPFCKGVSPSPSMQCSQTGPDTDCILSWCTRRTCVLVHQTSLETTNCNDSSMNTCADHPHWYCGRNCIATLGYPTTDFVQG